LKQYCFKFGEKESESSEVAAIIKKYTKPQSVSQIFSADFDEKMNK